MKDLILNQTKIPKEQWRYGLRSSAAVGCGWIATHNALRLMGYEADIPSLIRYYEKQLPLVHGNAGTSFWGPAVLFRQWGFPVKVSCNPSEYDRLAEKADACILFYHKNMLIFKNNVQSHTILSRYFFLPREGMP